MSTILARSLNLCRPSHGLMREGGTDAAGTVGTTDAMAPVHEQRERARGRHHAGHRRTRRDASAAGPGRGAEPDANRRYPHRQPDTDTVTVTDCPGHGLPRRD